MYTDTIEMKCKPFYSMHFHKSIPGFFSWMPKEYFKTDLYMEHVNENNLFM